MSHFEKEVSSKQIFQGRVIDVRLHEVELEDGRIAKREVVHHHGGVCVVAVDDDGMLYLVRQYRFSVQTELLELPAGKLEQGEDPYDAGMRELEEEIGFRTDSMTLLTRTMPTVGYCSEVISIYLAGKLTPTHQHLDDGEFLDIIRMPFAEAVEKAKLGQFPDGKTNLGILLAAERRAKGTC